MSWKESLNCQSIVSQVVDKMRKKRKNLEVMVGYRKRFMLIGFTSTAVHPKIDNNH